MPVSARGNVASSVSTPFTAATHRSGTRLVVARGARRSTIAISSVPTSYVYGMAPAGIPHIQAGSAAEPQYGSQPHEPYQSAYDTPTSTRVDAPMTITTSAEPSAASRTSLHPSVMK